MDNVPSPDKLAIRMLGSFSLSFGSQEVCGDSVRSRKLWLLFKYLAAHRDRRIPPDELIGVLWNGENCGEPSRALQNLVYRLRALLRRSCGNKDYIVFSHGGYQWQSGVACEIDAELFEALVRQAQTLRGHSAEAALTLFEKAMTLYKGDFLPEYPRAAWAIPMRDKYRRLYLDCVADLVDLYGHAENYAGIISVCERALVINPYAEAAHANLIDALISQGKHPQAQAHYESVSAQLYRDLGAKPSRELKDAYKRIQSFFVEKQKPSNAIVCSADTFRKRCQTEVMRVHAGKSTFLVMFTIAHSGLVDGGDASPAMDTLLRLLAASLRRDDMAVKRSAAQCLAMLKSLEQSDCEAVVSRLAQRFKSAYDGPPVSLSYKIRQLTAHESQNGNPII